MHTHTLERDADTWKDSAIRLICGVCHLNSDLDPATQYKPETSSIISHFLFSIYHFSDRFFFFWFY